MGKKEEIKALEDKVKSLTKDLNEVRKRAKLIRAQLEKKSNEVASVEQHLQESENVAEQRRRQLQQIKQKLVKIGKQAERAVEERNKQLAELKTHLEERQYAIVTQEQSVVIPAETEVWGGVKSLKDVKIGKGSTVRGPIEAGGAVHVDATSGVEGAITAKGAVAVGDSCTLTGNITSHGNVEVGIECHMGKIMSGGDVKIGKGAVIGGVAADGAVAIGDEVEVVGDITYHGSVSIGHQVQVKGTISSSVKPAITEAEETIEEEMEEATESEAANVVLERKICPICGTVNKATAKGCVTCDEPLPKTGGRPKRTRGPKFRLPENLDEKKKK